MGCGTRFDGCGCECDGHLKLSLALRNDGKLRARALRTQRTTDTLGIALPTRVGSGITDPLLPGSFRARTSLRTRADLVARRLAESATTGNWTVMIVSWCQRVSIISPFGIATMSPVIDFVGLKLL